MKYTLLQNLLPHLEAYENAHPDQADPRHFAGWLGLRTAEQPAPPTPRAEARPAREPENVAIGRLLVFMNRYLRAYVRKALEGMPLGGVDEFVYLAMLLEYGALTKSDLIQRNRHEKPTGMEIIRRLLALGFVAQTDDPDDRRSKRLSLTPAGMAAFVQASDGMQRVAELLTGDLSAAEKMLLLQLLEKLEDFHQPLVAKVKREGLG